MSGSSSCGIEETDISDHVGFRINVQGFFQVLNVDPFVVTVPAVQSQYGIAVPVRTVVKKNRPLACSAMTLDFHWISPGSHRSPCVCSLIYIGCEPLIMIFYSMSKKKISASYFCKKILFGEGAIDILSSILFARGFVRVTGGLQ